ncbi:hypothetical protein SCG7109_AH_00400 [Chlamydiales bacterium SCGC AG-110-M15]|nr:hypothetical protein SCG7109_AH_00400 [Chlamydiales bacterium SCGC AG-110-M15]
MHFNCSADGALGLDISPNCLKIARVSLIKGEARVEELILEPLGDEKQEILKSAIDKSALKSDNPLLATAISSEDLLVRSLSLNVASEKDIPSVLDFQVEPLLPFPVEEAFIDWVHLGNKNGSHQLTIFAIPKSALDRHLDSMHHLGIEPESVSCTPVALATFAHYALPKSELQFVLHIGEDQTLCLLAQSGHVLASHSIHMGYKHFAKGIAADRNCDLDAALDFLETTLIEASEEQTPELYKVCLNLEKEISRTQKALSQKAGAKANSQVVLTGEHTHLVRLSSAYAPALPSENQQKFAIAIGLALSSLSSDSKPVNFRQKTHTYPHPWKRPKKALISFGALCFALAAATWIYCYTSLEQTRDAIKADYLQALHTFGQAESNTESLIHWSDQKLSKEIRSLEKYSQAARGTFPLQPPLPYVTQVLHWINELSLIRDDESVNPPLVIDRFTYSMQSRPQEGSLNTPYRIRVDLEFRTATPQLARKFREALTTPNSLVDPNEEITWNSNGETYRSSFFLNEQSEGGL